MKIAVAGDGKNVAEHFGHCQVFHVFETENGEVKNMSTVPNPGHKPGFLPNFLADMGAGVIIAGGMGEGAVDIFRERNMEVVTGASGDAQLAVKAYLAGTLHSNGAICREHQHHDECE